MSRIVATSRMHRTLLEQLGELPKTLLALTQGRLGPPALRDLLERYRSLDELLDHVVADLGAIRPVDPRDAARSVFTALTRHVPADQIEKVREDLPE
jgi:uncharacterized protein (DUF2267 family)